MRDLNSNIKSVVGIGNATLSADNTPAAIDLQGFNSALVEFAVGVGGITFSGTNKVEFIVTHSDDDATYTAVADADVDLTNSNISTVGSGGIVYSLIAAHAAATTVNVGYTGGKRYLKVLADFSGTHGTGTPVGVQVVKALPADSPVA
jgi:hypothetical protein